MDKATKTIQCEFPDGTATIVITESRELCLRAYETARLFGFRDAKECIRNYAEGTFPVVLETAGGHQPVKCIDFVDMLKIASKSRLENAGEISDRLLVIAQKTKIRWLEYDSMFLEEDLGIAIEGLKDLRRQLDEILEEIE